MNVRLAIGALAAPLSEQLAGIGFTNRQLKLWDDDADAIVRCDIRGFIPESTAKKAKQRLVNEITNAFRELKKLK